LKKTSDQIARIGLLANAEKPLSRAVVREAARLISRSGRTFICDHSTFQLAGLTCESASGPAAVARQSDLLLVFGGDGTMLRVVREINGATTPILGINVGRLGFLTAVPSEELKSALAKLWKNDFYIESRPLMDGMDATHGNTLRLRALNDIVISRGAEPRMIELAVAVNGEALTRYRCDGLIVSSPTGSTAYSLSAGGAIISPDAQVFALTPICPHTLSNRSLIIGMDAEISVKVLSEKVETNATADGQVRVDLACGDIIRIRRSKRSVRLLHPGGSSFFDTLRRKLHWSGSNI
jgi:NAD+ kinase